MSRRLRKRGFTRGPLETDQEPEDARVRDSKGKAPWDRILLETPAPAREK